MASKTGWLRGRVKAVTSGDCLVIMALTSSKPGPPPEKTITLSSLMAPKLARRDGIDEPFAWESREFLRKLCIGKEVTFKVDYSVSSIRRDFGSVFLGDKNVALLVVAQGWAKVREQRNQPKQEQQKIEASPFITELLKLEEQAKTQGLGRWSKVPGAAEQAVRNLPPSVIGDTSKLDAMSLLNANKGKPMEAVVEHVRDGTTVRAYLLPDFQFVQVYAAGIQAPSVRGRAVPVETIPEAETTSDKTNGDASAEPRSPLTSAQRIAASTVSTPETVAEPFALEAKHFTEIRVLHRDVRIVLEGVDKFSNLIGSIYYPDGDSAKDLALELVENGYAKYVEWSANMMEEEPKRRLKNAELQAKKNKLRIWTTYIPQETNSKPIHNQKFTGKVVEVVSGDCVIVADDSIPYGSPLAERRVNLSSMICPKMGNPRKEEKPAPNAREAKEFLRTRLIGRQVNVQMEYSRKIIPADGAAVANGPTDSRVMDFGSVFLAAPSKAEGDDAAISVSSASQQAGVNVAEMLVARGFGKVVRHRDFEERSSYYDALLSAEARAVAGKKGAYSPKQPPVMHITDLTTASSKKARDFLPFFHRSRIIPAVVEYVLSGHRFKLFVPKETCSIAFSFSGVRCPGRNEPYSNEAIALMRRRIMQRDVEIEVETVDRTGTFLGSLWESRTNMAIPLVEAGLAKFTSFAGRDSIPDAHLLEQAEKNAKKQKLKIWENYVEGEEILNGVQTDTKQKEVLKVVVTEVLEGGKFYVQTVSDQKTSTIQQQLASLNLQEAPLIGTFTPKKGDIVLAQYSADNSWNRAMIVNAPQGHVESAKDNFAVFYIDYGNQEVVPYGRLRPLDSVSSAPGLAQLCSLAYLKVPTLSQDNGEEAAEFLTHYTLSKEFSAMIEERDLLGGKVKGQGTGPVLLVTLVAANEDISINATMLQEGLARLDNKRKYSKDRKAVLDSLEKFQEEAQTKRRGMWQYGHYDSEEEIAPPVIKKGAGK